LKKDKGNLYITVKSSMLLDLVGKI